MIKNLQKKLLITLTVILTLFLWSILLILNWQNYRLNIQQSVRILHELNRPDRLDDFDLFYDGEKFAPPRETKPSGAYSEQDLLSIAKKIAAERVRHMVFFSVLIGIGGSLALFGISYLLSRWLVAPVEQAFQKQKQFISDASHELKTPLTVISANTELLEKEIGDNKWLSYIQSETKRMNILVHELLTLARLENPNTKVPFQEFSLSDACISVLLPFESVAFEKGIQLDFSIPDSILLHGKEEHIKQVVSIFMDNAIEHTASGGQIKVTLTVNSCKVLLTVANTGESIPKEEQDKIFDRFYRSDTSRNRSSGHYGLGLSIAKAIATEHQGTLYVKCENGWNSFYMELPSSL